MATENKSNLYQRISAVMQDVEYLKKDDSVGSGNYAYKAISEEKVTETVRASLIKNGLVILPVEQSHKLTDFTRPDRNGAMAIVPISIVDTKYKIVNIDNPQEFEILCSSGTGVDPQDKGVGKAMTYSYKYLLLRTFAIPTGEDPDKVHNNDLGKQQQIKPKAQPAPVMQVQPELADKAIINALLLNLEGYKGLYSETDLNKLKATVNALSAAKAEEVKTKIHAGILKRVFEGRQSGLLNHNASPAQLDLIDKMLLSHLFTAEEKTAFHTAHFEYDNIDAANRIDWLTAQMKERKAKTAA